jgi:hypothetical protein
MIRNTILLLFLLVSTVGYCQVIPADAKCPPEKLFSKSEIEPVYKPGIDSMKIFFGDLTFSPTTNGELELEVAVCYNGDVSLLRIKNKTNTELDEASLKRWLSLMTGWKPGVQNGRFIGNLVTIIVTLNEGSVKKVKCTTGAGTKTSS